MIQINHLSQIAKLPLLTLLIFLNCTNLSLEMAGTFLLEVNLLPASTLYSKERLDDVKEDHNKAKAVKSDDAKVLVQLWD